MFGNFIGSNMSKRRILHPKLLILIGGIIGIGGIYGASFTNWEVFRFMYPACFGLAVGFTIMQV